MKVVPQESITGYAYVQNAAVGPVRLPADSLIDSEAYSFDDEATEDDRGTVTLAEYWEWCNTPEREHRAPTIPAHLSESLGCPVDDYYVDACIIVERYGRAEFTSADLAEFLGVAHGTIKTRMFRGQLPAPRWPAKQAAEPHRWGANQVVEIVAANLRKAFADV